MDIKKENIKCPRCGKEGTWTPENLNRPFCSLRCKLIDLGDWADEKHRVEGDPINPDESSENREDGN